MNVFCDLNGNFAGLAGLNAKIAGRCGTKLELLFFCCGQERRIGGHHGRSKIKSLRQRADIGLKKFSGSGWERDE